MECLALHQNSSNGQYWDNASHFLYCCQVFDQLFHGQLIKEAESTNLNVAKLRASVDHPLLKALLKVG